MWCHPPYQPVTSELPGQVDYLATTETDPGQKGAETAFRHLSGEDEVERLPKFALFTKRMQSTKDHKGSAGCISDALNAGVAVRRDSIPGSTTSSSVQPGKSQRAGSKLQQDILSYERCP